MNEKITRAGKGRQTRFVRLNTHNCKACWSCIIACRQGVIGKVNIIIHKHAIFRRPELCRGCQLCAKACDNNAISILQN